MKTQIKHYASGTKYMVDGKAAPKAAYNAACAANVLAALHAVATHQRQARSARALGLMVQPKGETKVSDNAGKFVAPKDGEFTWGAKVEVVAPRNTLQRRALGAGREWYKHGQLSTNTRYNVVTAMMDALGDTFTWPQAQAVLKTCALGSGTPGSYWREFCRLEYIVPADSDSESLEGEE